MFCPNVKFGRKSRVRVHLGLWEILDFIDSGDCHFAVTRQSKLSCPALQGHIQLEGYALLKEPYPLAFARNCGT